MLESPENVESSFIKKECKAEKDVQEREFPDIKEECKPEIKIKPPIDRYDPDLECYFKNDRLIPIASRSNPELKDIFQICTGNLNMKLVCRKRPYRVRETSMFIIHQKITNVLHPFDLELLTLELK